MIRRGKWIAHMLASWLASYDVQCPDTGLEAYIALDADERVVPRALLWVGMLVALEQAWHALTLATLSPPGALTVRIGVTPRFSPPLGTILAWVLFTSLAILLIGLTFRSSAAVLAKTLHVAAEALFLIAIAVAFGYPGLAGGVGVVAVVALLFVFSLPCDESIEYAARSGMALDAINFLAYAWYGISRPGDARLWLFIWALGFHVVYLLSAITVSRDHGSAGVLVGLRILGMFANLAASEIFLALARRVLGVHRSGQTTLAALQAADATGDGPFAFWLPDGVVFVGDADDPLAIGRTAYAAGTERTSLLAVLPFFGRTRRGRDDQQADVAVLCAFDRIAPIALAEPRDPNEPGFVLGWHHVRVLVQSALLFLGIILGLVFP